jgi:hypothetical protein
LKSGGSLHEGLGWRSIPSESSLLGKGVVFNQLLFSTVTNGEYEIAGALESSLFNRHEARSGDVDQRPFGVSLDSQG